MPEVHYARSGDAHLAYQIVGDGPVDLLFDWGHSISISDYDSEPRFERFFDRLGDFARVIRFDPRGVGLSDPGAPGVPRTLEQDVADLTAVLDAAGAENPAALAVMAGGLRAVMLAAQHPERLSKLVLFHGFARLERAPDYPFGVPRHILEFISDDVTDPDAGPPTAELLKVYAPSAWDDPVFSSWWDEAGRRGASPTVARAQRIFDQSQDVRHVLPLVRTPVLVLYRRDCRWMVPQHGEYLAEHLPDARTVPLDGADSPPFLGDAGAVLAEVEEFVTGERHVEDSGRVLATVLFTDIVDSTAAAAAKGDADWKVTLDRHDAMVRRQVERFGGREVKTTGDGFLVTFAGPGAAIRCALAVRDGTGQLGLDVRVGLHTGEVEERGDDVGGLAVHIADRVCGLGGPGEVLVSGTVKDLVAGSGHEFEDRGEHVLKGVPGEWRVFSVTR